MDTYEKKYKESMAKMSAFLAKHDGFTISKDGEMYKELSEIFDELKESEDERMIQYFKDLAPFDKADELYEKYGFSHKDAIAWLEKQGGHANFRNKIQIGDKVTRNKDGVLVNLSQLNRVAKKQDEQKPVVIIPKFRVGDEIKTSNEESLTITKIDEKGYWSEDLFICCFDEECVWDLVEQNPAWSEEDEQMFEHIIEKATLKFSEWNCLKNDEINFLKSLHPQNKQEWTQDDIDMIDWLIRCCEKEHEELCNDRYGHQDIVSDLKRDCRKKWDWLESLKERVAPQSHWKPSEGQLECLGNAIDKAEKDYPTSD